MRFINERMLKKKFPLYAIIVLNIILALGLYFAYKNPGCANAQVCQQIPPQMVYVEDIVSGTRNAGVNPHCKTVPAVVTNPKLVGISAPVVVTLTGFQLAFNCSSCDHKFGRGWVELIYGDEDGNKIIVNPAAGSVSFDVKVCFQDRNIDDGIKFKVSYAIYGWP